MVLHTGDERGHQAIDQIVVVDRDETREFKAHQPLPGLRDLEVPRDIGFKFGERLTKPIPTAVGAGPACLAIESDQPRGGDRARTDPGMITSNLPFDEWTETFGSERLTGALLDRLTHHVSILEMNGQSYRLAQSRARKTSRNP
nr:ATP-binding protein [Paracoccus saliphilus]